nr:GNAT family N-acetyltransferase [Halomonas sp. NCCP-2165]
MGFCGVHEGNIERRFVSPEARGKGVGTLLVTHATGIQGPRGSMSMSRSTRP